MRRIVVSGSRDFTDKEIIEKEMRKFIGESNVTEYIIITGGARGVDSIADDIARYSLKSARAVFPAHWDFYETKKAGMIRNSLMLKTADELLAFPTKESIGTRGIIKIARAAGKIVKVVEC